MFKPRFARLVEQGTKRQTIRPIPKRQRDIPRKGDLESWREWTGLPYRSKQRELCRVTLTLVTEIVITEELFVIEDRSLKRLAMDDIARADGFTGWQDMRNWFKETHGLPFTGILIRAENA